MIRFVAIAAALVLTAAAPPSETAACPVAGKYRVAGTNTGGTTYQGTATIADHDGECVIRWSPPSEAEGSGTYANGRLKVRYRPLGGGEGGEATYTRQPDGTLRGTWSLNGEGGGGGTETLTPSKN
jgi:hypothetical protein